MKNNCQDCGCDDNLPVNGCYDNCPPADKCDNTFDLGCVTYTGDPVLCGGQTLLDTNESLESGLLNITNKICDSVNTNRAFFDVNFTQPEALKVMATPSGGVPPYSYEWYQEKSNVPTGLSISGPTNTNTLTFVNNNLNPGRGSRLCSVTVPDEVFKYRHYYIHLKLKITDSTNKVDYKNYLFYRTLGVYIYE